MISFFAEHQLALYSFLVLMGFIAGFIDAIAGGGGLISLPALTMTGMPISLVLGTNKLQSSIGTGMAVYKYYRDGLINFKTVARGLIMGLIGAVAGALLATHMSNQFMRYVVPFLMLGVFVFNLVNKSMGVVVGKPRMPEGLFFACFGLVLGFYDAFFGPGTGNFWIMAIVYGLGYTFLQASGYAKVLNLKSNLFSLVIFCYMGKVQFALGLIMASGQFVGGYLGAKMVILKGSRLVRPLFMSVVFVNILVLFYQLFSSSPSLAS